MAAIILSGAAGCGGSGGGAAAVTVFAAASLGDAFGEVARAFELRNPGVAVKLNFAGSQRLRAQLEFGAAADVFASADTVQMGLAQDAGLIAGKGRPLASAAMAVIVNADSGIDGIGGLAAPGVKLVLAHESVPAGQYARLLLERLSQGDAGLGRDFAARVLANAASEETSVKFVEQKVVLGQADAGIVYRPGAATATSGGAARALPLPPPADEIRAIYPIAALKDAVNPELAGRFVDFALSPAAQAILAGYGFDAP